MHLDGAPSSNGTTVATVQLVDAVGTVVFAQNLPPRYLGGNYLPKRFLNQVTGPYAESSFQFPVHGRILINGTELTLNGDSIATTTPTVDINSPEESWFFGEEDYWFEGKGTDAQFPATGSVKMNLVERFSIAYYENLDFTHHQIQVQTNQRNDNRIIRDEKFLLMDGFRYLRRHRAYRNEFSQMNPPNGPWATDYTHLWWESSSGSPQFYGLTSSAPIYY